MIFVYLLALILNYRNILKFREGDVPLFLLMREFVFILIFNIIFHYLALFFKISFLEIRTFLSLWVISLLFYFLKFKFMCITYSGFFCYILSFIFGSSISLSEILFLVGILHVFEGVYVALNSYFKINGFGKLNLYLPISINGFPIIFLIFYRREIRKLEMVNFKKISGILIIFYGCISMYLSLLRVNGFLGILIFGFLVLFHEFVNIMDEILYLNFVRRRDL